MNLSRWPPVHAPDVPAGLRAAIVERLAAFDGDDDGAVSEACALAAERTLRDVLARHDHTRAVARELLAADALATHACEAAASERAADPAELEKWCEQLIGRFAAVLNEAAP